MLARAWFALVNDGLGSDERAQVASGYERLAAYEQVWRDVGKRYASYFLTRDPDHALPPSHTTGVHAALVLLQELHHRSPSSASLCWRRPAQIDDAERETAALTLLARAECYADDGLRSTTFPVAVLDDRRYAAPDRIDDKRLKFLRVLWLGGPGHQRREPGAIL